LTPCEYLLRYIEDALTRAKGPGRSPARKQTDKRKLANVGQAVEELPTVADLTESERLELLKRAKFGRYVQKRLQYPSQAFLDKLKEEAPLLHGLALLSVDHGAGMERRLDALKNSAAAEKLRKLSRESARSLNASRRRVAETTKREVEVELAGCEEFISQILPEGERYPEILKAIASGDIARLEDATHILRIVRQTLERRVDQEKTQVERNERGQAGETGGDTETEATHTSRTGKTDRLGRIKARIEHIRQDYNALYEPAKTMEAGQKRCGQVERSLRSLEGCIGELTPALDPSGTTRDEAEALYHAIYKDLTIIDDRLVALEGIRDHARKLADLLDVTCQYAQGPEDISSRMREMSRQLQRFAEPMPIDFGMYPNEPPYWTCLLPDLDPLDELLAVLKLHDQPSHWDGGCDIKALRDTLVEEIQAWEKGHSLLVEVDAIERSMNTWGPGLSLGGLKTTFEYMRDKALPRLAEISVRKDPPLSPGQRERIKKLYKAIQERVRPVESHLHRLDVELRPKVDELLAAVEDTGEAIKRRGKADDADIAEQLEDVGKDLRTWREDCEADYLIRNDNDMPRLEKRNGVGLFEVTGRGFDRILAALRAADKGDMASPLEERRKAVTACYDGLERDLAGREPTPADGAKKQGPAGKVTRGEPGEESRDDAYIPFTKALELSNGALTRKKLEKAIKKGEPVKVRDRKPSPQRRNVHIQDVLSLISKLSVNDDATEEAARMFGEYQKAHLRRLSGPNLD